MSNRIDFCRPTDDDACGFCIWMQIKEEDPDGLCMLKRMRTKKTERICTDYERQML